jgi:hypothetical protein
MFPNIDISSSSITRRSALFGAAAAGIFLVSELGGALTSDVQQTLRPEEFGALGDGVAADGAALAALITAANNIPGTGQVAIMCRGAYLLQGAPARVLAPFAIGKANPAGHPKGGRVAGLPPITRDNVVIDAADSEFIVPQEFGFGRTMRGGDQNDSFFVGWQFLGRNCTMRGGIMRGNLQARSVARGPNASGFGGGEFGLVMEGDGWLLDGVTSENWGTDCLLITGPGRSVNGIYRGGRRNCISVVTRQPILETNPVIIEGGSFTDAGNWPDDVYNNPSAGIDVEGLDSATVIIRGVTCENNRLKDIQISTGAHRCVIENCSMSHSLRFRPKQLGGHMVRNNRFSGSKPVWISPTYPDNEPIVFENNCCTRGGRDLIRFHGLRAGRQGLPQGRQKILVVGESCGTCA